MIGFPLIYMYVIQSLQNIILFCIGLGTKQYRRKQWEVDYIRAVVILQT